MRALPERILCLVTDLERAGSEAKLLRIVHDAVRGGVNMVQVRGHDLNQQELAGIAAAIVAEVGDSAVVVVNASPEIALESGAAGVHLRENSTLERSAIGSGLLVGKSSHSVESSLASEKVGVDYIVLGTVFPSASHPGGATGGTGLFSAVTRAVRVPVIGIGGITAENASDVMAAGASGVAVIGAIIGADNPFEAAQALASAIELPDRP